MTDVMTNTEIYAFFNIYCLPKSMHNMSYKCFLENFSSCSRSPSFLKKLKMMGPLFFFPFGEFPHGTLGYVNYFQESMNHAQN